jgi:hypothetical protein
MRSFFTKYNSNYIWRIKWVRHIARMGEMRNASERKIPLEDLGVDGRKIISEGVNWSHLAQGTDEWRAFVNTIINFRNPQNAGTFFGSRETINFKENFAPWN